MLDRIRRDFDEGMRRLKWAGEFLAERTKVEVSLAKVVFECQKLQKSIEEKKLELGERVFDLRDDKRALHNAVVRDIIAEIESLKSRLDEGMAEARELGGKTPGEEEDVIRIPEKHPASYPAE